MSAGRSVFLALTVILFVSMSFANNNEAEAVALIERGKLLSDIRAESAPSFRLKLSFKIINEDGSVLEGAHTEVWVSQTQWRRETVVGNFRQTQIVSGRKRWLLASSTKTPEHLDDFLSLTDIGRFWPEAWKKAVKVADRELNGRSVRCVEVKAGPYTGSALCFDKISGTIVADIIHESGTRNGEIVCFYNDYQKFGDRVLARSYECDDDKQPRIEARVDELTATPATDPTFLIPPDGAKESVNCLNRIKPPRGVFYSEPKPPRTSGGKTLVVLSIVVGTDGTPHDLSVLSAPNHGFDEAALEAVRQWRFKPASCDGDPVEARIAVEVDFHLP